jgi:hypothetical protein
LAEAMLLVPLAGGFVLIGVSGMIAYPAAAWLAVPRLSRKPLVLAVASCLALHAFAFLLTG